MIFPLIAVFVGLVLLCTWLSTKPQIFNYPMKITEANAQAAYREGERMMVWVSISMVVLYAGAAVSTFEWNGNAFLVVGLVGLVGSSLAGIVRLTGVQ